MTCLVPSLSKRIAFFCYGNTQIGLGHVVGCIRLAKLMTRSLAIEVEFVIRESYVAEALIHNAGFPTTVILDSRSPDDDMKSLLEGSHRRRWSGIVINFCKEDLQRYAHLFVRIKEAGLVLIFMDNPIPPACWSADLLINALPHPPYPGYEPALHPACLDGLKYFLLDDDHERLRSFPRQIRPKVERILIAMGGGDLENTTAKIIEALRLVDYCGEVDIVLGAANPHQHIVRTLFDTTGLKGSVSIGCSDLPERIAAADMGFSALGLTTYEMAALGLPAILLPQSGLNQQVAEIYCENSNAAVFLGTAKSATHKQIIQSYDFMKCPSVRAELSAHGRYAVGSSKSTVIDSISRLF